MSNPAFENFFRDVKKIGFFGLGKSNLSIIRRLPNNLEIILRSESEIPRSDIPKGIKISKIYEGNRAFLDFSEEILFLSPSVRRERAEFDSAREKGVRFCSDFEVFLRENRRKIIAVSGSDGKSTTTTITAMLLSEDGKKTEPFGNIGKPFCEEINRKRGYSVLELSSFQLHYDRPRAFRAAITNITENHLNWHKDFEEYKAAKLSLLENSEFSVINADDRILSDFAKSKSIFAVTSYEKSLSELSKEIKAELYFTKEGGKILRNGEPILSLSEICRKEEHNIKNFLTAIALCDGLTDYEKIRSVAREFSGLAHRCELFFESGGIKYINSSIDTSPDRTLATLKSLPSPIILILGGRSKCGGYSKLRDILKAKVSLAILTGENRKEIAEEIRGGCLTCEIESFEDATLYAAAVAKAGDRVLLSPASVSYDSFASFEKRGEKFKEIIFDFYKNL